MILYLTSQQHTNLLDFLTEQTDALPIKKMTGNFMLKQFVIYDMRNFSHCTELVLDRDAFGDDDIHFAEAIEEFLTMYNARITVICEGLQESAPLCHDLLEAGVGNIVTAEEIGAIQNVKRHAHHSCACLFASYGCYYNLFLFFCNSFCKPDWIYFRLQLQRKSIQLSCQLLIVISHGHGNKNRIFFYPAHPKSIIMKMFHRKQPVFKMEIQAILRQLHLQFPIGRIFIHPCVFFQLVGQLCVFHRRKRYLLIQIPQHLQCQLMHLYFLCFLSFRIRSSSLLLP